MRRWVILVVGVVLTAYGLIAPDPTTLMLGCTFVGGVPIQATKPA